MGGASANLVEWDHVFRKQIYNLQSVIVYYIFFTFQPFSKHPPVINDLSFWIPPTFNENNFYDLVRTVAGELVETVELIDVFEYAKQQKSSHCYRLTYRHMEKVMTQQEVNEVHMKISSEATNRLGVQIR